MEGSSCRSSAKDVDTDPKERVKVDADADPKARSFEITDVEGRLCLHTEKLIIDELLFFSTK